MENTAEERCTEEMSQPLTTGAGSKTKPRARIHNRKVYAFFRTTNIPFRSKYPHHTHSCVNLHAEVDEGALRDDSLSMVQKLFERFAPFPLRPTTPLPILNPLASTIEVAKGMDPANVLTKQRVALIKNKNSGVPVHSKYKPTCLEELKRPNKPESRNIYKFTTRLFFLARFYDFDPDPQFDSNYNWYYTGGSLELAQSQGRLLLFTGRPSSMQHQLCAVPLKRRVTAVAGFEVKEAQMGCHPLRPGPVFQVVTSEHFDSVLVGVRQRNQVTVLACERDPSSSLQQLFTCSSPVQDCPFTSIALSPWYPSQMCTTDLSHAIRIWDLQAERSNVIEGISQANNKGKLQWCGLHPSYSSPFDLFFAGPSSVVTVDTREGHISNSILSMDLLQHICEPCDQISAIAPSQTSEHLVYVGTTHSLYSVDVRKPGTALQRWIHMLRCPPQYIKPCCNTTNRELIVLGGSLNYELVTLVNEWSDLEGTPLSRCPPYAVPHIRHTLAQARLDGQCLDPIIQNRLKLAPTGVACQSGKRPAVFSNTGAGDVFCQRLIPNEEAVNEAEEKLEFQACLMYWEQSLKDAERSRKVAPLFVGDQVNLSQKLGLLNDHISVPVVETEPVEPTWRLDPVTMFKCKDVFGPSILSAWDIKNPEDWDQAMKDAYGGRQPPPKPIPPQEETQERTGLVEQWLQTNPFSQVFSQDSLAVDETASPSLGIDFVSASQRTLENLSQAKPNEDLSLLKDAQRLNKPKKRRTDGF